MPMDVGRSSINGMANIVGTLNKIKKSARTPEPKQDFYQNIATGRDELARPLMGVLGRIKKGGTNTIEVDNTLGQDNQGGIMGKASPIFEQAELSAFPPLEMHTDSRPRETATRGEVRAGVTVATNDRSTLGKKLRHEGKTYVIDDMMGPEYVKEFERTGKRNFDIFMEDKGEALEFGRRNSQVEILDNLTEVTNREKDGFPFPDYQVYKSGDRIRADLNIKNNSDEEIRPAMDVILFSPSNKRFITRQDQEDGVITLKPGESTHYGLESQPLPNNAEKGIWEFIAFVDGKKVKGTFRVK